MGERVLRAQREDVPWDITTDVVVAGSGAAGWSAAIGAALNGAEVLVLEKDVTVGGTTAAAATAIGAENAVAGAPKAANAAALTPSAVTSGDTLRTLKRRTTSVVAPSLSAARTRTR